MLADHGAFNGVAQPTKFPAGFFHIFTGSYDYPAAHCKVTRASTRTRRPAAWRTPARSASPRPCTSIERMVDCLAAELGMDPAELRLKNFIQPEQFPYTTPTGWELRLRRVREDHALAMEMVGYDELRKEQAEKRARGEYMGIGISLLHRGRRRRPAQGHGHPRPGHGRRLRAAGPPHGQGRAAAVGADAGPGPRDDVRADRRRTSSGIPPEDIEVVHGDTDNTPVRSRHLRLAAPPRCRAPRPRWSSRKVRDKARIIAAAMLEVRARRPRVGASAAGQVKGDPERGKTIQEIALRAHGRCELPEGVEGHLDASAVYDPPNLHLPVRLLHLRRRRRPGHRRRSRSRRFVAVDDCGTRINPMIVEGQVHGGLADGVGMALMELIAFDEDGNCLGGSFMDYLLPTAMECPTGSSARR